MTTRVPAAGITLPANSLVGRGTGSGQATPISLGTGLAISGGALSQTSAQSRVDVASAATVNLTTSAANTDHVNITGTTTITGFTVAAGRLVFVRFAGALTLTNNASIVTQTGANILTQAGDTCILRATAANTVEVLAFREGRWAAAEGTAPLAAARAWVNFNGTGTVAIRRAFNVSSITDNGVGDYTVNFTTAMPDADYAPQVTGKSDGAATGFLGTCANAVQTASSLRILFIDDAGVPRDTSQASATIFR